MRRLLLSLSPFLLAAAFATAQQSSFPPFEKFRAAVLAGDSATLATFYSQSPPAQTSDAENKPIPMQTELDFWTTWHHKGLTGLDVEMVSQQDPRPDFHVVVARLAFDTKNGSSEKKQFVNVAQGWLHQGDTWFLGFSRHSAPTLLRQPLEDKLIYHTEVDPTQQIADAIQSASKSRKRILLVFGGNWCFDCHVLDEAFHSPEIAPTLDKSFIVLHIDIGQMDKNLDVAKKYDIPLDRGVPAIAVLDSNGKLLFSQKRGEFEAARSMAPEDILAFLNKWTPAT
jgi:thioredoxin 1